MLEQGLTIEEVDALTGPALGCPRTGTFRLADMVGIDILAHVAANFPQGVTPGGFSDDAAGDREARLAGRQIRPGLLQEDARRRWQRTAAWCSISRRLNIAPRPKPRCPRWRWRRTPPRVQERLKLLLANDPKKDKAARFLWPFLSSLWNFAADRIGEAANDAPSIDQAMRAGFNWELGPV